jgi:hypothetical protein
MEIVALCIAVLALLLSFVAWYRSRRNHDHYRVEPNSKSLATVEQRASEHLAATLSADHADTLRVIRDLQSRVSVLRQEAMEEIREDLKNLAQKLDRLAERAARELRDLKDGLDFTLLELQVGFRLTVDDAKAHLKVIEAKRELLHARYALSRSDLREAESRIEAALRNLEEAESLAIAHDENITALLRHQTEELLLAIRAKASTLRATIDALLERTDQLLTKMRDRSTAGLTGASVPSQLL